MADAAPAVGIGDNSGAFTLEEQAKIAIDEALVPAKRRWTELEASFGRAPENIADEHSAQLVTTLIAQMQALQNRIDSAHEDTKRPWLEAGRTIDGIKNRLRSLVDEAKGKLQARLTAYQVRRQAEAEAERAAERQRLEQEGDPEPGWTPAADKKHVTIRSDAGASAHLSSDIEVIIVDVKKIPKRYLERPRVLDALKAELKADLKKGDKINGAEKRDIQASRVRRG